VNDSVYEYSQNDAIYKTSKLKKLLIKSRKSEKEKYLTVISGTTKSTPALRLLGPTKNRSLKNLHNYPKRI